MRSPFTKLRWIAALALALSPGAQAGEFSIPNLNLTDFNVLVNEFAANSQYSSVTPASSLGGLWGFEFGVVGGITKSPETHALIKRNDPNTSFKDWLPHANVLGRLGLPYGITLEGQFLPKIKAQNLTLKSWGLAGQWTITDVFLEDFPVNLALKSHYTKTSLNYSQTISGVPATINFDNSLWGLMAMVSYKVLVLEPYLGLGYTQAKGTLAVSAAVPVALLAFLPAAAGQETTSKPTSSQLLAGVDLRLAFFSLGAEYARAFGKNVYNGRISFRF